MKHSGLTFFILFLLTFAALVSCDTEDPFKIDPPDFSTVPEPYDTVNVESVDLRDGVRAYIHEEGYGPFEVTARDQVTLYITLRTDSGDIIYSSFASGRTEPQTISMNLVGSVQSDSRYTILLSYTPGLEIGLLGMKDGEQRTIIVPPEQGYQDVPEGHANEDYKNSTLIYDVLISNIGPSKSR